MDALCENSIRVWLRDARLPVIVMDEVDSTSSECRRRLAAGEQRCLVVAERQSAGRGRQGRSFFSPDGRGLYMSLMFRPEGGIGALDGYTAYAAVAAARCIETHCGVSCGIKWVNDLYLNGKKVCGILTEAVGDALIVGIGINLLSGAVPEELRDIVGVLDCAADRNRLAADIVNELTVWPHEADDFRAEYRTRSIVLGQRIRFLHCGEEKAGLATEIAGNGNLLVETAEGLISLCSGEISLLGYGAQRP